MRRSMGPVSRSFITWETMTYCKFLECTPKSHAHLDEASRYFYVFKDKDTRNPPRCCRRCSPRCYNPSQVGPCKEGVTVLGHERSPTPVRPWLRRTIIATHRASVRRQQQPIHLPSVTSSVVHRSRDSRTPEISTRFIAPISRGDRGRRAHRVGVQPNVVTNTPIHWG